MGKRFKRSKDRESAVPATVTGSENLPEEMPSPPTPGELLQTVAVPAFLDNAVDAFEQSFAALFNHAQFEATRLGKTTRALELLENELLDVTKLKDIPLDVKVNLMQALAHNKSDSVHTLLAITRNITQTRAVAGILGSLRRMAEAHNAATSIAPGPEKAPSTRQVAPRS